MSVTCQRSGAPPAPAEVRKAGGSGGGGGGGGGGGELRSNLETLTWQHTPCTAYLPVIQRRKLSLPVTVDVRKAQQCKVG